MTTEVDQLDAKTVEQYLNETLYDDNDSSYIPSEFALEFVTFIKLVNGAQGEEHKTPVVHYKMLDKIAGMKRNILNMCSRGLAKTTIMGEYLFLYIGCFGAIPGFGKVDLALYVSDSMENGVKNMRKNLEFRWENSDFLRKYIPKTNFTDVRWEFENADGNKFVVKGYGAKALSLDTTLFTANGSTTIGECRVGDKIYGADGRLTTITKKSEIFNRPMYSLNLEDGRSLKVCEEHINSVVIKENPNNNASYVKKDLLTKELLELPLQHVRLRKRKGKADYTSRENLMFVENCKPVEFTTKKLPIEPYTLGLLLGDGSLKQDGSCVLHAHKDDMDFYKTQMFAEYGSEYLDKRNNTVVSLTLKGLSQKVRDLGIVGHGDCKTIPEMYLRGNIEQRLSILKGLMDTDGCILENGRMDFCSNSENLVDGVSNLVRSLGGTTKKRKYGKSFHVEIWIDTLIFALPRKVARFTSRTKNLVAITSIVRIADEPSQCIAVDNEERQFIANDYFRTHNTGVRGSKEMGKRPNLAVLDDLVSDDDARSPTVIASIEDTVYKAIDYALHPTKSKTIWSGTPFNAKDPLYKAVESGAWHVSVYPICEKFPVPRSEFRGAWEDRFTFDYVNSQYQKALKAGKVDTFNQELMLRIMSDEDRLLQDSDIGWYNLNALVQNKHFFNFYITTDFATSDKEAGDFSVISVWATNHNGDWFWVDGVCRKQLMDANIDDLFRLCRKWKPQEVGIEVSGQQGGFIQWIEKEMITRNCFFTLASDNNGKLAGIRPNTNKMVRFNSVLPWFKQRKIRFPEQKKDSPEMIECMDELTLAAKGGFKSKHDDFIDTISMLASLNVWLPSDDYEDDDEGCDIWDDHETQEINGIDSYIV